MNCRTLEFFGQDLQFEQDNDPSLTHGGVVWDASIVLAKYFEKNTQEFSPTHLQGKKTAIELGSGSGLCTCVLALLGAEVLSTDLETVIPSLKANVDKNLAGRIRDRVKVESLDWTKGAEQLGQFDYIIASDVVYYEEVFPALIEVMKQLSSDDTVLIMSHEIRHQKEKVFFDMFRREFDYERVKREDLDDEWQSDDIVVIRATKRKGEKK